MWIFEGGLSGEGKWGPQEAERKEYSEYVVCRVQPWPDPQEALKQRCMTVRQGSAILTTLSVSQSLACLLPGEAAPIWRRLSCELSAARAAEMCTGQVEGNLGRTPTMSAPLQTNVTV